MALTKHSHVHVLSLCSWSQWLAVRQSSCNLGDYGMAYLALQTIRHSLIPHYYYYFISYIQLIL